MKQPCKTPNDKPLAPIESHPSKTFEAGLKSRGFLCDGSWIFFDDGVEESLEEKRSKYKACAGVLDIVASVTECVEVRKF